MERPKGSPPRTGEGNDAAKHRHPLNAYFQPQNPTRQPAENQSFALLLGLPQTRMLSAFTSALDEVEGDKAKADLCLWVAERGFLGLAYAQGLRAAAEGAYRLGDKLAGVAK